VVILKTPWLWAYWQNGRDFGFRRGAQFGFVLFPRPEEDYKYESLPGAFKVEGAIGWDRWVRGVKAWREHPRLAYKYRETAG